MDPALCKKAAKAGRTDCAGSLRGEGKQETGIITPIKDNFTFIINYTQKSYNQETEGYMKVKIFSPEL